LQIFLLGIKLLILSSSLRVLKSLINFSIKPQAEKVESSKSEGTRVEVYNFSLPQHRGQVHYTTIPDGVVRKINSKGCVLSAEEEAAREIAARKKKEQEGKSTKELIAWLGNAAETRKILEKDFKSLFGSLKQLEQQELATRQVSFCHCITYVNIIINFSPKH
jgi:hypothetical protein